MKSVSFYYLFFLIALSAFGPWFLPYSPYEILDSPMRLRPFSWPHVLGTDAVGRDVFSRIVLGARYTLGFGLLAVCLTSVIGIPLGFIAAIKKGFLEKVILRLTDVLMSFPSLLIAIIIVTILGPGVVSTLLAVTIVGLPGFIRLSRAVSNVELNLDYVQAARSFGAGDFKIVKDHVTPNALSALLVQFTLTLSEAILNISALGFLGMGIQAPTPEWGTMLADARPYMTLAPHLIMIPGIALLTTILALNLLGDRLRMTLDPKLRGVKGK
jgi:dipeptide transport system permease protein